MHFQVKEYKRLLLCAINIAQLTCKILQGCALLTEPVINCPPQFKIIPLHEIVSEWIPILFDEPEYFDEYRAITIQRLDLYSLMLF